MCELFALASRIPTAATVSLERFAAHAGLDQRLIDGWGIALHDGRDVRLYREPEPARDSAWVRFIASRRIPSRVLMSHVRHATRGAVTLANTQPFAREIAGRMHTFAHNGQLALELEEPSPGRGYRPIGESDSERAGCRLFERIARLQASPDRPPLSERFALVRAFAAELRELGPANFLYCDGTTLFAHADRRAQSDGRMAPPGLWTLTRHCDFDPDALKEAGVYLEPPNPSQRLTLVASVPLSDEPWTPLARGAVLAIEDGVAVKDG